MHLTLEDLTKLQQEHAINLRDTNHKIQHLTMVMHQITGAMAAVENMIKTFHARQEEQRLLEESQNQQGEQNATEERQQPEGNTTEH